MPAALPGVMLNAAKMLPTDDEVAEARKQIATWDEMKKASVKQGVKQFCKAHPEVDNSAYMKLRGDEKEPWLELFVIHQLRCKEVQKTSHTERQINKSKINFKDVHWMSKEVMDREVGTKKATLWRDCGVMKARPDQLTGSLDEDCIEWPVPKAWSRMSSEDLEKFWFHLQGGAEADDYAAFEKRFGVDDGARFPGDCAAPSASDAPGAGVQVKIEKQEDDPEEEKLQLLKRIDSVKATAEQQLKNTRTWIQK